MVPGQFGEGLSSGMHLFSFCKDLFHLITLLKPKSKSATVQLQQSHISVQYIFGHQSILYHIQYSTLNVSLSHLCTLSSLWLRGLACQSSFNMYNA